MDEPDEPQKNQRAVPLIGIVINDHNLVIKDRDIRYCDVAAAALQTLTVETVPRYPGTVSEVQSVAEASTEKYHKLVEAAKEVAGQAGVNLRSHLAFGSKAKTFKEFIEKNGVDLLVLGYTGRSPLYERTVGSTLQSLVRVAPCSVLVVKQPDLE